LKLQELRTAEHTVPVLVTRPRGQFFALLYARLGRPSSQQQGKPQWLT